MKKILYFVWYYWHDATAHESIRQHQKRTDTVFKVACECGALVTLKKK